MRDDDKGRKEEFQKQDKGNQMERWRQEYEEIPVPEEAKNRLNQGIRQAKKERAKRRTRRWFQNSGAVAAAAMAVLITAANTSQAAAETLGQIPVLGSIVRVVTFRDYKDQSSSFEAKVEVPGVEIESVKGAAMSEEQKKNYELTNSQIDAYARQFIEDYEQALKVSQGEGNYALDSSYKVLRDDEKYLSIRIDTTVVMAGGNQYVKVFNIDKATGKAVSLGELFADSEAALTALADNMKEQMRAHMKQDDGKSYFLDTEYPGLNFQGLTGEESYYFNENGELVLLFNEYDVAPGYMGIVEFTIPESVTADYLNN